MTRRLKKFALSNYVKNPANSPYESSSASLVRARPAPYASAKRACFSMADWDPELYHRFRGYRAEPVERMLARLSVERANNIVDLGCGTGEHTVELARRAAAATAVGLDSSHAMIERALTLRDTLAVELKARVAFKLGDFRDFAADREYDIVFSNAVFQWVSDHRATLAQCYRALRPGGSLAVQMPANDRETAQVTIHALANEPAWRDLLGGIRTPSDRSVQSPDVYRAMLSGVGFVDVDCHYHTFRHPMGSPAEVVEWSRATVLRPYLDALGANRHESFIDELTSRLEFAYGTSGPIIFQFRRLFLFARRTEDSAG
jgi:trans-aconitate 2-methyltransferase